MGLDWKALRARLSTSLQTKQAIVGFASLQRHYWQLERFGNPEDVVEFLVERGSALGEKNAVCSTLIQAARRGAQPAVTMPMLWLGLWPGLSGIYRSKRPLFRDRSDRLISLLSISFHEAINDLEPERAQRPIATLVRNTRRRLEHYLLRGRLDLVGGPSLVDRQGISADFHGDRSHLAVPTGDVDEQSFRSLRLWLVFLIGRDADLVIAATLHERPRCELARHLGASPLAIRSRLHRALRTARKNLQAQKNGLQHLSESPAYLLRAMKDIPLPAVPCPNHQDEGMRPVATVRVGDRLLCRACAGPESRPAPRQQRIAPEHLFGTACWIVGDLAPSAICPRCLYDAFVSEADS